MFSDTFQETWLMCEHYVRGAGCTQATRRPAVVHRRPLATVKHARKTVSMATCPTAVVRLGKIVLWLFQWSFFFFFSPGPFCFWTQLCEFFIESSLNGIRVYIYICKCVCRCNFCMEIKPKLLHVKLALLSMKPGLGGRGLQLLSGSSRSQGRI